VERGFTAKPVGTGVPDGPNPEETPAEETPTEETPAEENPAEILTNDLPPLV
jgi:hypothetical protein